MQRMLLAAQRPVLYNLTLSIPGISGCELYPYPVPDLCSGMPLMIAGKYEGDFPPTVTVNGTLPDGTGEQGPHMGAIRISEREREEEEGRRGAALAHYH